METQTTNPPSRWLSSLGLVLIVLALAFRFIPHLTGLAGEIGRRNDLGVPFFFIALFTFIYTIVYIFNGARKTGFRFWKYGSKEFIPFVILLSIGCFSLNEGVGIFAPTVPWLTWVLGLSYAALTCYAYFDVLPRWLNAPVFFLLGLGTLVTAFYTLVLLPILPFAFIGILFFGLGLYCFGPLFSLIVFIKAIALPSNRQYWKPYAAGIVLPLLLAVGILVQWGTVNSQVEKLISENKTELPNWLYVDLHLEETWMTQYYLLSDVQYSANGLMRSIMDNGSRKHYFDPLVEIASTFVQKEPLGYDDKLKLLEARYDFRHMKQRRLWSGNNLGTTAVETDIQVWPEYRMAYVEQDFVIHHNGEWGTKTQEAIYTFYLPDGAVASSLSLWIEGKEEFSRLTTKSKADSAYRTIVGVERRDPALLHWQEGNTLVVTVFPCTRAEDRRFSIGITVPMAFDGTEMTLPYIAFQGPYLQATNEITTIRHGNGGPLNVLDVPMRFTQDGDKLTYNGPYKGAWDVKLAPVPLATQGFSFNGHSYSLKPYERQLVPFNPTKVALDINSSWQPDEISALANLFKHLPIYVPLRGHLTELSVAKNDPHFEQQISRRYSLFPFNKVENPNDWIIITKTSCPGILPNLLKGTGNDMALKNYFSANTGLFHMLDLGTETSLYLNTFRQFGIINYHRANLTDIEKWYNLGVLPAFNNNPAEIELAASQMKIVEDTDASLGTNTPDHLLRLFAYNKVLHQIGGKYFQKSYVEDEYIALAELAHIVTPISSMVVLESVKDYDRFGIKENANSLKNAGEKGAGAVPEPHEWALIILSLGLTLWLYIRRKRQILAARWGRCCNG